MIEVIHDLLVTPRASRVANPLSGPSFRRARAARGEPTAVVGGGLASVSLYGDAVTGSFYADPAG